MITILLYSTLFYNIQWFDLEKCLTSDGFRRNMLWHNCLRVDTSLEYRPHNAAIQENCPQFSSSMPWHLSKKKKKKTNEYSQTNHLPQYLNSVSCLDFLLLFVCYIQSLFGESDSVFSAIKKK